MKMLSVSSSTVVRSSLEEMLENIRGRDEKPKHVPPALPSRPNSKARLPPARRLLPFKCRVSEDAGGNEDELRWKSEGSREERELGFGGNCFGNKKKFEQWGVSPYVSDSQETLNREMPGVTAVTSSSRPVADSICYFMNKRYFPGILKLGFKGCVVSCSKKLRVWCQLPAGEWELGKIQSMSGEVSLVQLSTGNVVKVSTTMLLPANPEILEGVDDLIQLCYLNEPSILFNLQYRFSHDMIYSKAGPVLIAINPFKDMQIYGNNYITAYRQNLVDSPHVFATADAAYNEMIKDGVKQSIIISLLSRSLVPLFVVHQMLKSIQAFYIFSLLNSGESGTGKTETAKLAMQYLATVCGGSGGIERAVLQTSCILEAFGNAKTSMNDNSSRFSRVVQLAKGERSYHAFYQLCAGAPSILRDKLNLKTANEYKYLNQSNCQSIDDVDDAQLFHKLTEALDIVQISKEDQEGMFAMLAVVLWLGNISFQITDNGSHIEVVVDEAIATASRLMGCSLQDLILVLSTRNIQAGKDIITKKLTLQEATDTRDALAKFIYASLFDWLVEQINKSLVVGELGTGRSISILDIYGFESFQKNSFEQFCINYANERLQQHFSHHLLKLEQEDYEADGIDWTKVDFRDNQECLDLFEKKPLGLLSLLDAESYYPKSTDLTFAGKLKQHLDSNPCFKGGAKGAFSVHHFAGEVLYDTGGFLEKNRDQLNPESVCLLSCCFPLLKLFADQFDMLNFPKQSVGTKFKGQLHKLMQRLGSMTPHFIHCVKPNNEQLPSTFKNDLVLKQLRCCGVLEVIKIVRSGYPTRITHQEFAKRYGFLVLDKNVSNDPLSISVAVLQRFNVLPEMYRVGYTKLYFLTGQIGALESTRKQVLQSLIGVQKCFRGYKARSQFDELKKTATTLQAFVRAENARRKFVSLSREGVHSKMQKCKGGASKTTDEKQRAIIQLQSVIRGWLARKHFDSIRDSENRGVNINGKQDSHVYELKDLPEEHTEVPPSVLLELQRRILMAESTLAQKEKENAALRVQLQQYDNRWSDYEAKMRSMEEMWQKQITSLQASLATAKKGLVADTSAVRHRRRSNASRSPRHESDDEFSIRSQTPDRSTPHKLSNVIPDVGLGWEPEASLKAVNHVVKDFEHRKPVFIEDAKAIADVKLVQSAPRMNTADEELQRLRSRFEAWKKEYKVQLRETQATIHKLGHPDRARRRWWCKLVVKTT
ncbi:hypothetical protein Nepgr_026150 [Nepenthes gracilis]|uniref:Uncharacterized protein n=1 Tax=Nepenthes gracilis TaxID=150966 RepID=A0AAD3T7P9_NEPGR|nr:hypothetical protein Nepgr_026150 [Nepenthes gracilis]